MYGLKLKHLSQEELDEIGHRVDYYARCAEGSEVDSRNSVTVGGFRFPWKAKKKHTTYFFDLYECVRCFPQKLRFSYLMGDVAWDLPTPTFAKTRPITQGKSNTVILPLNKVRHFRFINDTRSFREKRDMIVFRNSLSTSEDPLRNVHSSPHDGDFVQAHSCDKSRAAWF